MNVALFKPNGSRTENEVGSSLDIAVLVILSAFIAVDKQNVLISNNPAIQKGRFITPNVQRNRLAGSKASVISERQIVSRKIVGIYLKGI
jgi:hypothetical protein